MSLTEYKRKRDFKKTTEPKGTAKKSKSKKAQVSGYFVIQKHEASHLHYDFRLELDGVLKSWAVPKGPSLNPKDKRLAMQVEDHPTEYGEFEGIIPEGEYGGGTVMLWDQGEWESLDPEADILKQWNEGSMKIKLNGNRLKGAWALVRMKGGKYGKDDRSWLLIKERDDNATETSVTEKYTNSVTTNRTMDDIASGKKSKSKSAPKKGGLHVWKGKNKNSKSPDLPTLGKIEGSKKSSFPPTLKPQLATLVQSAPVGKKWVHEIKFDGYRFVAFINKGKVTLRTRNGKDWTEKFQSIAEALSGLPVESAIIDGELVALDDNGVSNFQLLQNSLKGRANPALAFYTFDLMYLNGYLVTGSTLEDRKKLLENILQIYSKKSLIRYSEHFTNSGEKVWDNACRMGLEGIISKDLNASYEEKRTKSWVKVKCTNRQEFVIGGYTEPSGTRTGLGALLIGLHDSHGKLQYAGKVGTGFTDATLKELHGKLIKLERKTPPFANLPTGSWTKKIHWVTPSLIGEVAYTEMTTDGLLRHPSFQGLREDKPAKDIALEEPTNTSSKSKTTKKKTTSKKAAGTSIKNNEDSEPDSALVKLTNPDRILFPDEKYTKKDLADYYAAVKPHAFKWLSNRPITLVRCPQGRSKPCFYQRHNKTADMVGLKPVNLDVKGDDEEYIYLQDPIGLQTLVQNSTLEIHGWQCSVDDIDHPDRIIFDIDPSPEVEWKDVIAAAKTIKKVLEKCGLATFVMTTGGKGLHVVVPLKPKANWDEVKEFSAGIAHYLESTQPNKFTANLSKKKRIGKVFVDYLRNGKAASAILPFSSRARPGATVATPLAWSEVTARLDPGKFTIKTIPKRINTKKGDPWKDYEKSRQILDSEKVVKKLQELT